jgi:hypothetical protein
MGACDLLAGGSCGFGRVKGSTVLNGPDKESSSAEGVVDDQRNALLLTDLGDGLEVGDVVLGVSNALDVDGLGVVVDGSSDVLRLVAVYELGLDSQAREHDLELVVGSAVQVGGSDNVVAGVRKRGNGHELGALAGGGGDSCDSSLQRCNSLLENIDRRLRWMSEHNPSPRRKNAGQGYTHVHNTAVDVAELLESEEARAVGGIIENKGLSIRRSATQFLQAKSVDAYRSSVDRDSSRLGARINILAFVSLACSRRADGGVIMERQSIPSVQAKGLEAGHDFNFGDLELQEKDEEELGIEEGWLAGLAGLAGLQKRERRRLRRPGN